MLVLGSSLLLLRMHWCLQLLICQWLRKLPGRLQQPMVWPMFPGPNLPLAHVCTYIYIFQTLNPERTLHPQPYKP